MYKIILRYKNYAFRGSDPPDPFLECQRFVNLTVYFIRARSSLILFLVSFYITLFVGMLGGKKRIVGEGRGRSGGNRSSIIGKIVFHILFML